MWGAKRWKLQKEGTRTMGTVVELTDSWSTDDEGRRTKSVYPVVEFPAEGGRTVKFRGSTGSNPPSYQQGQLVSVIYDRKNPDDAQIADFEQFWLGPVLIGVFGLVFLGAGVGSFFLIGDSDKEFKNVEAQIERQRKEMERRLPPR
jgi:hypothetical protein